MSHPVQAQSTSSLVSLLANPPRYPRNPTHQPHDALVLYILRVPGSRDVFLTPLKPPTKASISIEAVQSSIYFLHVERPEDEHLRQSLEASRTAEETKQASPITIQRKPLPKVPNENYPPSRRPQTPPKSYPYYQPSPADSHDASQAERYAHRGVNLRLSPPTQAQGNVLPRRPVGARPMASPGGLDTSPTDPASSSPQELNARDQGVFNLSRKPILPALPTRTYEARGHSPDRFPDSRTSTDLEQSSLDAIRITLIRRDPASGSQWNVGTIAFSENLGPKATLGRFDIELTSPGYARFVQNEGGSGKSFSRKTGYMIVPNSAPLLTTRKRSNSAELFSSATTTVTRKPRQAYSFLSPWQGMCSFSNGIDGKSLRCRHVLPSADPSVPGIAADVAELRFNLPWAKLKPKDSNSQPQQAGEAVQSPITSYGRPTIPSHKDQWRRSLQNFTSKAREQLSKVDNNGHAPIPSPQSRLANMDSASQEKNEDGRMNLDLGRERAGGGFKGNSAKLGKLIIEDEGLKMCDLVVAACMGVWWQHYTGNVST